MKLFSLSGSPRCETFARARSLGWRASLSVCSWALAVLAFAGVAHAQSYTWNVTTGDWNTAANWSPAEVPLSTGTVSINSSRTATIDSGTSGEAAVVRVGYGGSQIGTLNVDGSLTTGGNMELGIDGGGTVNQGQGSTVTVGGTLFLASVNGGSGVYNLGDSTTLSVGGIAVRRGTFIVPTTATFALGSNLDIAWGTGGNATPKSAAFTYSNPSVALNVPGNLNIGESGYWWSSSSGTFNQSDNTTVNVAGSVNMGMGGWGGGTYNVGTNTTLTIGSTFNIKNGAFTVPETLSLSLRGNLDLAWGNTVHQGSSTGIFTYNRTDAPLIVAGSVRIAESGQWSNAAYGTFNQSDNTAVAIGGDLFIGNGGYGVGAYNLGDGTSLTVTGATTVGSPNGQFVSGVGTIYASGRLNINRGTVNLVGATTIGTGGQFNLTSGTVNLVGATTIGTGGQFNLTSGTVRMNGISGAGAFNAGPGLLAPWNADATVSAPLTLTGTSFTFSSADKDGVGRTLTLSGSLALNGLQLVKTGLGTLSLSGTVGQVLLPNGASVTAGTLRVDRTAAATLTGTISGAGSFQKSGAGTLALTAANTYTGTTTLTGGVLQITSDANISGTAAPLVFDGGTLGIAGTSLTSLAPGRTTSFAATKTVGFVVADAANTFTVGQALDQTTGGLAVTGPGTLVLAGANTYSGTTSVTGGGLRLDYGTSDTSKLSNTAALTLTGATVTLAGGSHTEAVGSTTLAAGRTTILRDGGSSTLQLGAVTRSAGATLDVATSGLVTVTNNNTNGIVGGWLTVGGSDWGVNSTTATPITMQNATATFSQTSWGISGAIDASLTSGWAISPASGSIAAQTAVFETASDLFASGGGTLRFSMKQEHGLSHIIGRFALYATTADRSTFADGLQTNGDVTTDWTLLDPSSFASLNGATLTKLSDGSILASGANPATDNYTIVLTTSLSGITGIRLDVLKDPSLPSSGPGRASNGNFVLENFVMESSVAVGPVTALASGSYFTSTFGSLGPTTANATVGANTTVGTTTINSLRFGDAAAYTVTGSAATTLTLTSGGILVAPAVGENTSSITGATLTAGATNLVINQFNTSGSLAIDSVVAGSGGVFKTGPGALSLGGSTANTFTGGLSVYQGEVQLAKSGAVNAIATGPLTIGSGGSVRYTGASTDMIANAVAIQLNGSGFLDFAGATDTVGAVTVNAANAGANAQVLRNTGAGGTLTASSLTVTPDDGYATTLGSGSGLLVLNGAGQFNVNGSGRTVIAGGLSLGNGNRTFTVNDGLAADDLTISAAISSGTLTKDGAGTLVLTGSNAHTMALSAGRLDLNNANALGAGTFTITGGTIGNSSGGAVTNLGNNAQAWNGNFTFTGPNALDLGTGAVTMNAARIVTVTSGSLTVGGTISGAGLSLTKQGPGTLVLSASNAYTGVTNLGSSGGTDGGILRLTGAGRISNAATTVFAGTLDMTDINQSVTTLTLGGGAAATTSSVLTGSGTLTLGGGVTYTATNNPGGGTIAGNLNLGNAARTFDVGNSTAAAADLTVSANITSGTLTKSGSGTLVLSGSNSFAAGTLSLGQLDVNNAHALGTGTFTISAASTLGNSSGSGLTNLGNNAQAWNADFTFAGPNDLNLGTGAVAMNANRTVTVASNTLTVGGTISGASRNLTKAGSGTLLLTANNTYTGTTTITEGTLAASSIGAGGSASPLGTSATVINLGSGTLAGFLGYTGSGETATRGISLVGNRGGLDAGGTGALNFNGPLTAAGTKTLVLTGTSTAANRFSTAIAGLDMSVEKTGMGTWLLSGANSFGGSSGTGRLTVLAGTLVADGNAPNEGSGVFGAQSSLRPIVGAANATGSAALLVGAGYTVSRAVEIAAAGTGTQEAILGGMGAGVSEFDNLSAIYLGRSALTLAADTGNEARFYNAWLDGSGGGSPAAAFNVGTSLLSGTVGLMSFVPDSITAVNVRHGTLRLAASGGETLGFATQVTVGSGLGSAATLDLANAQQSLASLRFSGSAGTVVGAGAGGVLQFSNNGAAVAVTVLDGTGHDIQSAVSLGDSTSFDVALGGRLGISGVIATGTTGPQSLTKIGLGILELTGANTYTGNTTVSQGLLRVNGSLAAASTVTVASGGVLGGTGLIAGSVVGTGGLIAPGASPGILTVQGNLAASGSTAFAFEFSGTGAPTWSLAAASVNDVLRLTGTSPFTSPLSASNVVNVYFEVASLALDDTFRGGFYVDNPGETAGLLDTGIGSATFAYFVLGDGVGNVSYNDKNYYPLASYSSTLSVTRSVVNVASANFAGGTIENGQVTQFVIVPEPGALALAGVGVALAVWTLRRRRQPACLRERAYWRILQ